MPRYRITPSKSHKTAPTYKTIKKYTVCEKCKQLNLTCDHKIPCKVCENEEITCERHFTKRDCCKVQTKIINCQEQLKNAYKEATVISDYLRIPNIYTSQLLTIEKYLESE